MIRLLFSQDSLRHRLRVLEEEVQRLRALNTNQARTIVNINSELIETAQDAARYRRLRQFYVTAETIGGEYEVELALAGDTESLDRHLDTLLATERMTHETPQR